MPLPKVHLGTLPVSRFIIGGNPFSGFSHQSLTRSQEMVAWYTQERIVETLFQAQALGVTACIMRGDEQIAAVLRSYWDQGGTMVWVGQTDSRAETIVAGAQFCLDHGAAACFLHGGVMDHCVAQEQYDELDAFAQAVRDAHVPVGVAGHRPGDFTWAENHLPVDFYMVCYYNPADRALVPHHDPEATEHYTPEDREERVATLATLGKPAIHYKILAAGRLAPEEAFAYATDHMRPDDAVCVGIHTQDAPHMLATDVDLLLQGLRRVGQL
jgi:hypothetical protein